MILAAFFVVACAALTLTLVIVGLRQERRAALEPVRPAWLYDYPEGFADEPDSPGFVPVRTVARAMAVPGKRPLLKSRSSKTL